jgi:hypothetical protein
MVPHLSLLAAHTEIERRLIDAEQRRRARSCRRGFPINAVLTHPTSQP